MTDWQRPPRIESDQYEREWAEWYRNTWTDGYARACGSLEETFHDAYSAGYRDAMNEAKDLFAETLHALRITSVQVAALKCVRSKEKS